MKFRWLVLSLLLVGSLKASEEINTEGTFSYMNFDVKHNKVASIGFGCREIHSKGAIDWNIGFWYPVKITGFSVFFPIEFNINYLYFVKKVNLYYGAGTRTKIDFSRNYFTPVEFNPCVIVGFLTKIGRRTAFVELKSNFLRFVKLFNEGSNARYDKTYKDAMLKSHYFSVNFGTYF